MEKFSIIESSAEYFSVTDTLTCGQAFRFIPCEKGYKIYSADKCAYVYQEGDRTYIECEKTDEGYFYNYFDLSRDYEQIYNSAIAKNVGILTLAANAGKGIRLLNQNLTETLFSFIVSQNNNIPRIKGIIEKLCASLGEKKSFRGEEFYAFPSVAAMADKDEAFYKSVGLGYRAEYIRRLAESMACGLDINVFSTLSTKELKSELVKLYGVGRKVADCVALFGYRRGDSFPVDTWIEKVYRDDFDGKLTDREKIADELVEKFGENAGYYQQYLFHYKRNRENVKR